MNIQPKYVAGSQYQAHSSHKQKDSSESVLGAGALLNPKFCPAQSYLREATGRHEGNQRTALEVFAQLRTQARVNTPAASNDIELHKPHS
ncbi:hypothetical protein E1189_05980 [Sansalvadorimonas verongulae]|nr:hypothetical protein [Sansalvadorimonas verongulae]